MMQDCISRQAAIDALADMHCKSDEDGYVWIIRSDAWARIDALPSAQPEIAKDINVPSNDCISRQAAIDLVNFECGKWTGLAKTIENGINALPSAESKQTVSNFIESLPTSPLLVGKMPSAQPEIIHCRDCKHKPSGDGVNHNITFPDEVCPCQCDDYWYSWIPNDDWYCGDAERREE